MDKIDFDVLREYMVDNDMNSHNTDDIQDAIVEIYLNDYHFTDRELTLHALEFLNFLFMES